MPYTKIAIIVSVLAVTILLYFDVRWHYRCGVCMKWTLRADRFHKKTRGVWRVCRNDKCRHLFDAEGRGGYLHVYGINESSKH